MRDQPTNTNDNRKQNLQYRLKVAMGFPVNLRWRLLADPARMPHGQNLHSPVKTPLVVFALVLGLRYPQVAAAGMQFSLRGHLNIEDSDFATEPVDADRYNSLLIHARQVEALLKTFKEGYLDLHVEVNRSNHESPQGECSSRPGLFDGLLAAVQEAMESPSDEENSLGSLLAAIEQETERHNSPPRQSQEETDVEPTDPIHSSRLHDDVEGIDIFVDLVLDRGSQKVPVWANIMF
ncbi:hypothetical protein R1sor_017013 [Riccia sorocarpa]|uniref:Uncharacterized protein n=1 Tax=Riccia sorocarpa TaxID=122646 RepID=A0ABD3I643_9MARC